MDASGVKREIGRTSITSIRKEQGKTYPSDMLGVALIRNFKAAAGRSTPLSSAQKWTPRRAVNSTSPCHSLTKIASSSSKLGKTYSSDTLGVALIRDLRAAAGRSTPLSSSARKWTPRRAAKSTSPCRSLTKIASSLSKSVFLHDWWLINADGKGLAIGGSTYINERKNLFRSAVIIKRHDAVTVETKDGMTVLISGNINRQYSLGNGFSTEIVNRFMFGFPCDWEEYASESTKPTDKPSSCPGSNNLMTSLDQIPVRNIRDFVSSLSMNETELLMKNIYEDLQKQLGKRPERASVGSKNHQTTKATSSNVGVDDEIQIKVKLQEGHQVEELKRETSSIATKAQVEKKQKTDKKLDAAANNVIVPKTQVFTRSMKRTLRINLHDSIFQSLP